MAGTAERRLDLILRLLAVAHQRGPAPREELARALECTPQQLERLIDEITQRSFYLPPGASEDIRVYYDADGLQIETTGEFRRPMRLTGEEALALSLALRMRAAAGEASAEAGEGGADFVARIEAALCPAAPEGLADGIVIGDQGALNGHAAALAGAASNGKGCEIEYLKPGAERPDPRTIHPYAVVMGEAGWYLLAHCRRAGSVRVFRVDRVVGVRVLEEGFARPDSFEVSDYLDAGTVYRPGSGEVEARVRYSPEVAPWVRERGPVEEGEEGSVEVRFPVADPDWVRRHVLQFGGAAELLEPAEWRARLSG
jgi:proteasome accessory factor C